MQRVLITGASGFVGSHLAVFLAKRGYKIWASFHRRKGRLPVRVRWVPADLTEPPGTFDLVRVSRPRFVFHLAGLAVPALSWKDPAGTLRLNTLASIFLFEAVLRFAPKAKVVVVSSPHVYGGTLFDRSRIREENLLNPTNPYGVSKALMEMAVRNYVTQGLQAIVVRAFNHVGPGQRPQFVFADFSRQVAKLEKTGRPGELRVGDLEMARDFVHIDDAVSAYELLARRGIAGEVYNLGTGRMIRLREVVDFLKRRSRVPFEVVSSSSRVQPQEIRRLAADTTKLRRLGWRPRHSPWEALEAVLEEWRKKV